jgi:hypothetical protein
MRPPATSYALMMQMGMIVFALFFLTACQTGKTIVNPNPTGMVQPVFTDDLDSLSKWYARAMVSAENPRPATIVNTLTPIIGNKALIDTVIGGDRHVKMVSWKNKPSYWTKDSTYSVGAKYAVWVTVAPFIQDECKVYFQKEKDPEMRLRQLLGLQPFTIETDFVEIWVRPADLFRPCPDSETSDTECSLELPENVSDQHRQWFNHVRAVQYNDCNDTQFNKYGYPWTQLGYTYDWNPENPTHVGLSEFVIKSNAEIFIRGIYPTKAYCSDQSAR